MRPLLLLLLALGIACSDPPAQPGIVLVTLDTTRPDHLSVYGYGRPTTPHLDALAARGVVFADAWAQAAETGPSLASTLTSRRAPITRVRANAEPLAAELPTLATAAREAGYATAAFVSTVLLRDDVCGFQRGFDVYDDEMTDPCFGHPDAQRIASRTVDRALAWVNAQDGPFLLWVHLYDPHGPYTPPRPMDGLDATRGALTARELPRGSVPRYQQVDDSLDVADYVDRYDREIAYMDAELGRLLERVDLARTIVAVHADHGEALGEDDYWFRHGSLLHDAALRIPLILAGPGIPAAGDTRSGVARNLDLAPTLLSLAGLSPLAGAEGAPLELRGADHSPRPVIAEARRRERVKDGTGIDTRWKLRHRSAAADVTWFPGTPDEVVVHRGDPDAAKAALEALAAWLDAPERTEPERQRIAVDVDEALRTLGYR